MIYLSVLMLLVGGGQWKGISQQYSTVAACELARSAVIRSAIEETKVLTLVSNCATAMEVVNYGVYSKSPDKEGA